MERFAPSPSSKWTRPSTTRRCLRVYTTPSATVNAARVHEVDGKDAGRDRGASSERPTRKITGSVYSL